MLQTLGFKAVSVKFCWSKLEYNSVQPSANAESLTLPNLNSKLGSNLRFVIQIAFFVALFFNFSYRSTMIGVSKTKEKKNPCFVISNRGSDSTHIEYYSMLQTSFPHKKLKVVPKLLCNNLSRSFLEPDRWSVCNTPKRC